MKKIKASLLIVAICAVVVTFFSQGTLAYYSTVGTATNVVTSGKIKLVIHETTGDDTPFPQEGIYIIPGQIVSKRVNIENACDHPFYLRVKLVNGINSQELSAQDCFNINLNNNAWTLQDDGFIYYNKVLNPGEKTPYVFTEVEIVGEKVNTDYIGKALTLTVNAYAVQQENNPAEHPWLAVGWPTEEVA
ncbi:MAG: hypothetical protein IJP26_04755 [Clostridia bacterium]|nr:hypothetical protein [Clostridia bacterium]